MLEKIAKKLNLPVSHLEKIIVMHHKINYLVPKKTLKTIKVNLLPEVTALLIKVAKALKVEISAVVAVSLLEVIKKEQREASNAGTKPPSKVSDKSNPKHK